MGSIEPYESAAGRRYRVPYRKPKVSRTHRYLTPAQLHHLADASGPHRTLILLLGYTGLRWGEACALRVKDVDLEHQRLDIVQNALYVGGEMFAGSPKTRTRRSVPFPALLREGLTAALVHKSVDDLIFPGRFGKYQTTPTIRGNSWFGNALTNAGLPPMAIHDLRHTTASLAVSAGANVKAVQRMLGHSSAAMTLDLYADLFNDDFSDIAKRLNEAATGALDRPASSPIKPGDSDR